MQKTHYVKSWPEYFDRIACGTMTCDIRKNDRQYERGDIIHYREFVPQTSKYTGKIIIAQIEDTTDNPIWLQPGFVALSIRVIGGSVTRYVPALVGKTDAELEVDEYAC